MEIKVNNPHNLDARTVDGYVCRVKILPVNSNDQILLCNVHGAYSFIGGHVDEGEDLRDCFKREMREETGIDVDKNAGEMFFLRQNFENNHFNTGKSCLSEIYYIFVLTDEKVHTEKSQLSESEKQGKFRLEYVSVDGLESKLKRDKAYREKTGLYNEMIEVVKLYKDKFVKNKPRQAGDE